MKLYKMARFGICAMALSVLLTSFSNLAKAEPPHCESYPSRQLEKNVDFCIQRSRPDLPPRANEPVIYFMHGIFRDANFWAVSGYAETIEEFAKKDPNFPSFTIVSFSTSALSFFSDSGSLHKGRGSYESWFITEFIPMMEKTQSLCHERACRLIAGQSMGGFGALKTAFRYPELFSAVAASSPALPPFNFQESTARFISFFKRHPIGIIRGLVMLKFAQGIFTTPEYADENDPSYLARIFPNKARLPQIYIEMGGKDDYGLQEGYARFTRIMRERHLPYEGHYFKNADHGLYYERRPYFIRFLADHFQNQ
ncbi:MAG: hypothetical protein H7301_09500 [Cryobacterium sp.]|nr:hypothetical protein [Oligoflexia bacterium]